jgi:hypothetical protein
MRKRMIWLISVLVVGASITAGIAAYREPVWDYNFVVLEKPRDMQILFDMGEDGWEVAGAFKDWHGNQCMLLKRRR